MATTNPWKQFEGLLPRAIRFTGTVTAHHSNGTSSVTLRDGSLINAKGQGVAIGEQALIEKGAIVRPVPSLTTYTVQI